MGDAVVGRDDELAVVDEFVQSRAHLPAVLVVEGEAGIGKTTIWRAAVASLRSDHVLTSSPSEGDTSLAFGGLADLIGEDLDAVLDELPSVQAHALAVAVRRSEPSGAAPDHLAIRSGFLTALRVLSTRATVVVAVDDVHWLDRPSALALSFAMRRVRDDEPLLFVLAHRSGGEAGLPLDLARAPRALGVRRLEVGPLSLGALHNVLRSRLEQPFPRPVLRKIHEISAGNPFYALELGQQLARQDFELSPYGPIPVPLSLTELLRRRLDRLDHDSRDVLLGASALARPSPEVLEAAYGRQRANAALEAALGDDIIEHAGGRLRFSHPLFASTCYALATPGQRRRTHRLLSTVIEDLEESARHLALAVDGDDEAVAARLETAALSAAARGAPSAAAELMGLALAHTPRHDTEAFVRRALRAGDEHLRSGDAVRARAAFRDALPLAAPGSERAPALVRLCETEEDLDVAIELADAALAEAEGGAALSSRIHCFLAFARTSTGLPSEGFEHARLALEMAEFTGDDAQIVSALTQRAEREYPHVELAVGLLDRALKLERRAPVRLFESPRITRARGLTHGDRYDEARAIYGELLSEAEEHGDEWARLRILWNLAQLEVAAGHFEAAARHATVGLDLAEAADMNVQRFLLAQGESAAYLGRVEEARAELARCLESVERTKSGDLDASVRALLGFLALSLSDPAGAAGHLRDLPAEEVAGGTAIPHVVYWGNAIEALIGTGELELAAEYLASYEQMAHRFGIPRELGAAARCRALLDGARGELDDALGACKLALAEHARSQSEFERARTLLVYGATLRRAKRRRDARAALDEALAEFERLSTPLWAERARAERARVGGRTRSGELTETERQIAALVAEGRSNKEIAAALYLTPKTVETRLSRMYAKLGIHSRGELARKVFEEQRVGIP